MSKSTSGHFKNTKGFFQHPGHAISAFENKLTEIATKEHFKPHPTKQKQLSSKKLGLLRKKRDNRTITKQEYKALEWNRRLSKRRNEGIDKFWADERKRLSTGKKGTRNWTPEQIRDIISNKRPVYHEKSMSSHHMYSVKDYPHLANRGDLIYPATHYEHKQGWHGGNYRNSLPGKQINKIEEF